MKFEDGAKELERSNNKITARFKNINSEKFTVEIYINGEIKEKCKIWLGSFHGQSKQIYYSKQKFC